MVDKNGASLLLLNSAVYTFCFNRQAIAKNKTVGDNFMYEIFGCSCCFFVSC